jgi:acyl-CoA synthetase (AMP-forming)/AMP-acid ligase II
VRRHLNLSGGAAQIHMNLARWILKNGRCAYDRPAISIGGSVHLTYGQWAERSGVLAAGLRRICQAEDRVAIAMANNPFFLEILFAIWHAGLVAVPMNARLHPDEFGHIIQDSEASLVVTTPELADAVAPHCRILVTDTPEWHSMYANEAMEIVPRRPEDLAWLFYTSGTTGRPKGAMLTHRNLLMASLSYHVDVDPVSSGDGILHAAPMSHGSGIYALPFVAAAANNLIPESASFHPGEIAAILAKWDSVSFYAAPTMVIRLINDRTFAGADHSSLKTLVYGGGPMHFDNLARSMEVLGPRLAQIYGQGESPMTITSLNKSLHADALRPRWREIMSSVGLPRTDVDVRVFDAEDRELPVGEIGEVVCRGDVVMAGYWRNPQATKDTLRGGWLHTGDIGCFDTEGFLTLKDRSKDLIISGGANIYPREIEEVLLRHPSVLEVSVIGRQHAEWGEEVVACVVVHPGRAVTETELDSLCLSAVARFKRPRAYLFLDTLPKNNYGKVLKTELRKRYNQRAPATPG